MIYIDYNINSNLKKIEYSGAMYSFNRFEQFASKFFEKFPAFVHFCQQTISYHTMASMTTDKKQELLNKIAKDWRAEMTSAEAYQWDTIRDVADEMLIKIKIDPEIWKARIKSFEAQTKKGDVKKPQVEVAAAPKAFPAPVSELEEYKPAPVRKYTRADVPKAATAPKSAEKPARTYNRPVAAPAAAKPAAPAAVPKYNRSASVPVAEQLYFHADELDSEHTRFYRQKTQAVDTTPKPKRQNRLLDRPEPVGSQYAPLDDSPAPVAAPVSEPRIDQRQIKAQAQADFAAMFVNSPAKPVVAAPKPVSAPVAAIAVDVADDMPHPAQDLQNVIDSPHGSKQDLDNPFDGESDGCDPPTDDEETEEDPFGFGFSKVGPKAPAPAPAAADPFAGLPDPLEQDARIQALEQTVAQQQAAIDSLHSMLEIQRAQMEEIIKNLNQRHQQVVQPRHQPQPQPQPQRALRSQPQSQRIQRAEKKGKDKDEEKYPDHVQLACREMRTSVEGTMPAKWLQCVWQYDRNFREFFENKYPEFCLHVATYAKVELNRIPTKSVDHILDQVNRVLETILQDKKKQDAEFEAQQAALLYSDWE